MRDLSEVKREARLGVIHSSLTDPSNTVVDTNQNNEATCGIFERASTRTSAMAATSRTTASYARRSGLPSGFRGNGIAVR